MRIVLGDDSIVYTSYIRYDPVTQMFDNESGVVIDLANVMEIEDLEAPA